MLSIVVPVYNEVESLGELYHEIDEVASEHDLQLEIVFVDDGSSDGSWEAIADLAAKDSRIQGIRFRRNFGKAAALNAAFESARGEIVLTLDADLQDDPAGIADLIAPIEAGSADLVSGWKYPRRDPLSKRIPS
ncbi:MAG: glycosyltransferase family 2 protein, partial [Pirellulaceae bacterium]|nr:glycosyltransferase family 2 protein [Pirellulaceae bacterium]